MGLDIDNTRIIPNKIVKKIPFNKSNRKNRPELKASDLNVKTATREEVDSIRIKSYSYAF